MADRDMSYDLDGVFSTRNQGQLVSSTPVAPTMTRTPGLTQMRPAMSNRGMASGWVKEKKNFLPMGDINLPLVGSISVGAFALAMAGLGILFITRKK